MSSSNQKIEEFVRKAKENALAMEGKQKPSGTAPTTKDIREHFEKSRNEIKVGERTYNIKKFGIRATINLVPILGSSLAVPLSSLFKDGIEEGEMGISGLTEALMLLFGEMGDGKFYDLLEIILSETYYNEKVVDIEEDFDDLAEVLEVCVRVFEVNFSVFMKHPALSKMMGWGAKLQQLQPH